MKQAWEKSGDATVAIQEGMNPGEAMIGGGDGDDALQRIECVGAVVLRQSLHLTEDRRSVH